MLPRCVIGPSIQKHNLRLLPVPLLLPPLPMFPLALVSMFIPLALRAISLLISLATLLAFALHAILRHESEDNLLLQANEDHKQTHSLHRLSRKHAPRSTHLDQISENGSAKVRKLVQNDVKTKHMCSLIMHRTHANTNNPLLKTCDDIVRAQRKQGSLHANGARMYERKAIISYLHDAGNH